MKYLHKFQTQSRGVILLGMVVMLAMLLALNASAQPLPDEAVKPSASAPSDTSISSDEALSIVNTASQSHTVTYAYDDAGRLVVADYGEGKGVTYTYDAAGNLLQRKATGVTYPAYLPVVMQGE